MTHIFSPQHNSNSNKFYYLVVKCPGVVDCAQVVHDPEHDGADEPEPGDELAGEAAAVAIAAAAAVGGGHYLRV